MKIAESIGLGIAMQLTIMILHLLIHFANGSFEQDARIACSFIAVALVTYLTVICFDLPVYTIFCGQIVTLLFTLIFENERVYLLHYLHRGSSQWFNPDIFTDAVIIITEMLIVQLLSFTFAKLTRAVCRKIKQ